MEIVDIVLWYASIVFRFLGLLVFGLTGSWLILKLVKGGDRAWQTEVAALIVFFGFAGAVLRFVTEGGQGAFLLGSGIGIIIWGIRASMDGAAKKK